MSNTSNTTSLATTGAAAMFAKAEHPLKDAMALAEVLVRSKIMGVENPGDALAVVLTCMAEGITPIEFARTYHVIGGRLSMRADAMLAKFIGLGGRHKWAESTDDVATLELTIGDESVSVTYTIADARRANLFKSGGAWETTPRAMLRARASSEAVRMIRPNIVAGVISLEEVDEINAAPPAPRTIDARRAELQATAASPPHGDETIIGVEIASPAATGTGLTSTGSKDAQPAAAASPAPHGERQPGDETEQPAPAPDPADGPKSTDEQRNRMMALLDQCGITPKDFVDHLESETGVRNPRDLTVDQAETVIANLERAAADPPPFDVDDSSTTAA